MSDYIRYSEFLLNKITTIQNKYRIESDDISQFDREYELFVELFDSENQFGERVSFNDLIVKMDKDHDSGIRSFMNIMLKFIMVLTIIPYLIWGDIMNKEIIRRLNLATSHIKKITNGVVSQKY